LKSAWAAWAFPLLAVFGSVMLLFHEHHGGMHSVDHLAVMRRVQAEHLHFAIAGGGIGVVKGLSELPTPWKAIFTKSWPLLLIVLRSEEHTSELQSRGHLVCRLLLEKKK